MCILACMLILVICGSWHDIKCFYTSNVQPLNRLVVNAEYKKRQIACKCIVGVYECSAVQNIFA